MTKLLDDKVAAVVGHEGRLGPIWIKALLDEGAFVVQAGLPEIDISTEEGAIVCARVIDHADILVMNAGIDSRPGMTDLAQQMVNVNILGTKRVVRAVCETWVRQRRPGVVVLIASLYGLVSPDLRYYDHREDRWAKDELYGATKAAVIHLAREFAAYYGAYGIRVNALAPGGVVAGPDGLTQGDPEFARKYTARIPMGRMATPADLGGPLVFLASDMSSFVTGTTIPIEGGYLCW